MVMNVINSSPIIHNPPNAKPRSVEQLERETVKLDRNVSNEQDSQARKQTESIRVIRVANDGLKIAEFGAKNPSVSNGQSTLQRKPTEQYQNNQQLSEREEIGELLGIDTFA